MRMRDVIGACLGFGGLFYTVQDVAAAVGGPRDAVRHRLWKLEHAGLITRVRWHRTPPTYRKGRPQKDIQYRNRKALEGKAAALPVHEPNGWDRLWKAARIMRRFSMAGLASITGESLHNVRTFAKAYRSAGWMKPTRKAGPEVAWVFIKKPPVRRPYYGGKSGLEGTAPEGN